MKTYTISPDEFAAIAAEAADAGAEVVYCVDSAGGMFPEVVRSYFEEARARSDVRLGFHGHNNLMLAAANSLEAWRGGCEFIDVTLCGLGRSAGNLPAEVMVAMLDRLDVDTGIDLFDLLDTIETYLWPLVGQSHPHDALSIAIGFAQFHSSHLPKVRKAAAAHGCDARRLLARMASHDLSGLDEDTLAQEARALVGSAPPQPTAALLAFQADRISPGRIAAGGRSVSALVQGMEAVQAKCPRAKTVIHVVPSDQQSGDMLMADFVSRDPDLILGRVHVGSPERLEELLDASAASIGYYLVEAKDTWGADALGAVAARVGERRAFAVDQGREQAALLADTLDLAGRRHGVDNLLVYACDELAAAAIRRYERFAHVWRFGDGGGTGLPGSAVGSMSDWRNLGLQVDVLLLMSRPREHDMTLLARAVKDGGAILSVVGVPPLPGLNIMHVPLDRACLNAVQRALAAATFLGEERL